MDAIFPISISPDSARPLTDEPVLRRTQKTLFKKYLFFSVLIHLSFAGFLWAHLQGESNPTRTARIIPVFVVSGIDSQKDPGQTARIPAPSLREGRLDEVSAANAEMTAPVDAPDVANPTPAFSKAENAPAFPLSSPSPSPWAVKTPPLFFSSNVKKFFIHVQDQLPGLLQRSLPAEGLDELKGREREVRILFNPEGRIQNLTVDSGGEEILSRLFKEQVPWDSLLNPLQFGLPNRTVLLRIGIGEGGKISVYADLL